ncbi:MAG: succinoglycan biosynthesis protein ExoM [Alphaproteobacteria bacterium]|jgi:succinoglycan biosynthesis protein ExoM
MNIIIAVCTYKRFASLIRCLKSIQAMIVPPNITLEILVIDNEPSHQVSKLCGDYKVTYVAEKQRGLVFARNSVLRYARSKEIDYLGIIDDDEGVSLDWLVDMLDFFKHHDADVAAGIIDIQLASNMPSYLKQAYQFKKVTQPTSVKTLPMGNIMLKSTIINTSFWFDTQFNFTGGEDVDFFSRLHKSDKKLYKIPNAQVTEYLMPEKASLSAYFKRQVRVSQLHYSQKFPSFSFKFFLECLMSIGEIILVCLLLPTIFFSDPLKIKVTKMYAKAIGRLKSRNTKKIQAYGK